MSAAAATDELYHNRKSVAPLGIIAMPGAEQLAEQNDCRGQQYAHQYLP